MHLSITIISAIFKLILAPMYNQAEHSIGSGHKVNKGRRDPTALPGQSRLQGRGEHGRGVVGQKRHSKRKRRRIVQLDPCSYNLVLLCTWICNQLNRLVGVYA